VRIGHAGTVRRGHAHDARRSVGLSATSSTRVTLPISRAVDYQLPAFLARRDAVNAPETEVSPGRRTVPADLLDRPVRPLGAGTVPTARYRWRLRARASWSRRAVVDRTQAAPSVARRRSGHTECPKVRVEEARR
jgi:hypothetical protein